MLFTYVGTIGEVALVDKEDKYYLAPNVALIRSTSKALLPEFMRYYFQSTIFWKTQINRLMQSSSMQNIPMEKIRKFIVPLPPLIEQQRIVSILDRFDSLCNNITSGLPAEIAARQKQYEYYRNKLLTFKAIS
jgi:type I restriction enzyme S subunit